VVASSAFLPCVWRQLSRLDFDAPVPVLRPRNGQFQQQGPVKRDGRSAWLQGSDWSQLFLPAGPKRPDVFAVQASFLAPAAEHRVSVTMQVYVDPAGPLDSSSSDTAHGRGIVLFQAPGSAPKFEWGVPEGVTSRAIDAKGSLPGPITDRWHALRIEGSRSHCWLRVLLDGAPILVDTGHCDLAGGDVLLGSGAEAYLAADVLWRELAIYEGEPSCQ